MKKYVRTNDGKIYKVIADGKEWATVESKLAKELGCKSLVRKASVVAQADTIEELIDELVIDNPENWEKKPFVSSRTFDTFLNKDNANYQRENNIKTYGAIWTNKGLIYVAKMNDKGELELL